jgi:hypothetical protein
MTINTNTSSNEQKRVTDQGWFIYPVSTDALNAANETDATHAANATDAINATNAAHATHTP